MSFLGYDPGRLSALRRRLDDLADEANGLRFDDAAASEAADSYQRAVRVMTDWRVDLAAIASCAFDSPFQPVALDGFDPAVVDVLRPLDAAWTTVTDPRSGVVVSAEDHARHLAEALAAGHYRVEALATSLTTALATASTRDVLLATLGPDRFAAVLEDLARSIARAGAGADDAERLLRALAAAFGSSHRAGTIDRAAWEHELVDEVDPYAAALVLVRAGLGGELLSRLAKAAWDRWRAAPNIGIDSGVGPSSQTLPLVVQALGADPVAARRFIESLTQDDLWSLFGGIDVPPRLVLPFLLASADPRSGPAGDIEHSMLTVLTFVHDHGRQALLSSDVYDGLGAYVGPYLEQLLGPDDGARYPYARWSISEEDAAELVSCIARNGLSAASLIVFVDALVATRFAELVAAGPVDGPVLDHLGWIAGRVDRLVADARLDVADEHADAWAAAWGLIGGKVGGRLGSFVPGFVPSTVVSKAVSYGIGYFGDVWQERGWVGAPVDPDAVIAAQRAAVGSREDERQASLLAGLYAAGIATGAIPATTSPPPPVVPGEDYLHTRTTWRNGATDEQDFAARDTLWRAAEAFEAGMGRAEDKWSG
jgi:hypothetical protein